LRSKKDPTALADAPNAMKTAEKPSTKAKADQRSPPRGAFSAFNCSTPIPDNMDM
jgi:hypothetical protein